MRKLRGRAFAANSVRATFIPVEVLWVFVKDRTGRRGQMESAWKRRRHRHVSRAHPKLIPAALAP